MYDEFRNRFFFFFFFFYGNICDIDSGKKGGSIKRQMQALNEKYSGHWFYGVNKKILKFEETFLILPLFLIDVSKSKFNWNEKMNSWNIYKFSTDYLEWFTQT
jgi:hypothetical protein